METGQVNNQAGAGVSLGEANPITADELAFAIAKAQFVLGTEPPPFIGKTYK